MKWSNSEEKELKSLYDEYKCFTVVANQLKRSTDAVQARYVKRYVCTEFNTEIIEKIWKHLADNYKIPPDDFIRYLKYNDIRVSDVISSKNKDYNELRLQVLDKIKIDLNLGFSWFLMATVAPCVLMFYLCKTFYF